MEKLRSGGAFSFLELPVYGFRYLRTRTSSPNATRHHATTSRARRRWIIGKESAAGLGFTETKYFGESCDDVSPDEVEIGWMLTPQARGQGYATEAGRAVRDEAFERLKLVSIVAVHHAANLASSRVIERLGMAFEREVVARNGWPLRLYRLTREQRVSNR